MSSKESAEILKMIEKKLSSKTKKHKYDMQKEFDNCTTIIKDIIKNEFIKESDTLKGELKTIIGFLKNNLIHKELEIINSKIKILHEHIQENIKNVNNVKIKIKDFLQKRTEIQKKIINKLEKDTNKIQESINRY